MKPNQRFLRIYIQFSDGALHSLNRLKTHLHETQTLWGVKPSTICVERLTTFPFDLAVRRKPNQHVLTFLAMSEFFGTWCFFWALRIPVTVATVALSIILYT
jgi:hypothetical protein